MTTLQAKITGNQPQAFRGNVGHDAVAMCDRHGAYELRSIELMGKTLTMQCPDCQKEISAKSQKYQDDRQALVRLNRVKKLLECAAIPPRFKTRRFENFSADTDAKRQALYTCRSMAVNFDTCLSHGTSVLMCGKPGTGKSHLAAAMAIEITQQGRSAVYTTVLRAVRSIKDTYRKDSQLTEQQAINAFIAPDFLILDEVGVQFGSESEKMYLFEILNGRYENQKPTAVITNLPPKEVERYLGERIIDRLSEGGGGTVIFDWESYRPKVVGDENLPKANPQPVNWESHKAVL